MDINTITTFINTVGFPISCVAVLAWYVKTLTEEHKKEVDALAEQINKMSIALTKLTDKIDELKGGQE